jgi:hypothetical protein
MQEIEPMQKLFLTVLFLLFATCCSLAQDFNPGTVVGNVFQDPRSGCGYGFGLGCYPPNYEQDHHWTYQRHHARRRIRHDVYVQH